MGRVALMVSVALALLFAVAGPSSAFQCPKLIKQVNEAKAKEAMKALGM